ncbi:hypothetical protein OPQ81_002567 [Rhizoctonia solani]|nr:hypothetical protein OPQ81_002567 [Rhizoctonia solani]
MITDIVKWEKSFCVTFGTFGFINSWGVFQDYYGKFILVDFSPATIAWIGSTQLALAFFPGLMVGRLFELGYFRIPQVIASTVLVSGTFLIGECTEFWHFLVFQGIGIGVACGFLFGPALAVVSHWFQKRRGLALGIMASGASVGGTAIPITVQKLIPLVGFQWSIRVIGFIELIVLGISILTLRRRLPCGKVSGGLLNSNSFSHIPYLLYVMAVTVSFLGLYTVLTYLQRYGVEEAHLSPQFAMYLIPIANSASLIGRVGSGHVVDKLGPLNTLIPSTLLAGATTFIWPLARTKGTLIAVSCVYGIAYGTLVGMLPAPVAKMSSVKEAGPRTGMLMTIAAFGALVGVPISGDILAKTNSYVAVGAYAGSLIMICVVLLIAAKCLVSKQLFSRS